MSNKIYIWILIVAIIVGIWYYMKFIKKNEYVVKYLQPKRKVVSPIRSNVNTDNINYSDLAAMGGIQIDKTSGDTYEEYLDQSHLLPDNMRIQKGDKPFSAKPSHAAYTAAGRIFPAELKFSSIDDPNAPSRGRYQPSDDKGEIINQTFNYDPSDDEFAKYQVEQQNGDKPTTPNEINYWDPGRTLPQPTAVMQVATRAEFTEKWAPPEKSDLFAN